MLRVFEAVVARRLFVNYRLDPEAVQALLPAPLEPLTVGGAALGGVSLARIEQLRPRGLSPIVGFKLESLAHRVMVSAPGEDGGRLPGVYVLRRDTQSRLVALDRRVFAQGHRLARFEVEEDERKLRLSVSTDEASPWVEIEAEWGEAFRPSKAFATLAEAARFLDECERGYAPAGTPNALSAVRLKEEHSRLEGVRIVSASLRFFEDERYFPRGAAELDSAFGSRRLPVEWVSVGQMAEILDLSLVPDPA